MLKPWLSRNQTPEIIQNHPNSSRTLQNSQNPLPLSVQTLMLTRLVADSVMFWCSGIQKTSKSSKISQRPLPRSPPPLPLKALIFIRVVRVGAAERGSFEAAGVSVLLHGGKSCWNLREHSFLQMICNYLYIPCYQQLLLIDYCSFICKYLSPLLTQLFTV